MVLSKHPTPCLLLKQNLVVQPTEESQINCVREILLRRLITLPNWPVVRLDAQYVTNLFFAAAGFNHLGFHELDDCRKDPSVVYTSRKPLFVVHPRFRRPFTSNRTVLIETLPLLRNWPSKKDPRRYIAFMNLFLIACRFSRLKPAEELDLLHVEEEPKNSHFPIRQSTPILEVVDSVPFADIGLDEIDSPPTSRTNPFCNPCKYSSFKK